MTEELEENIFLLYIGVLPTGKILVSCKKGL